MKRLGLVVAIFVALFSISIYNSPSIRTQLTGLVVIAKSIFYEKLIANQTDTQNTNTDITTSSMTTAAARAQTTSKMAKSLLRHAKMEPYPHANRGHSDHGWLNSYHSFSFSSWYDPRYTNFGSLRVLNEDRVKAGSGFPTHPHANFEIFSYVISGELTHRDSMLRKGAEGNAGADQFYRMGRGDVQFTTGGSGIAHSETNEHPKDTVHFLQIWALPWKKGLPPIYHTKHFGDEDKRKGFVTILSPLKGGPDASPQQEKDAEPAMPGTIPIHADFLMGAGIIAAGGEPFEWVIGSRQQGITEATKRKVFVFLPTTKAGKAKIRLDGREDAVLSEGDAMFVDKVNTGDKLNVESIGEAEAEVIVLDTA